MTCQYKLNSVLLQKTRTERADACSRTAVPTNRDCVPRMVTFQIAGYLAEFTAGAAEIKLDVAPATVRDALNELWQRHAGLRDRVLTEQGEVRQHVNVFVNSQMVRRDDVLDKQLDGVGEICIMPAVSGGAEARA